MKCSICKSEVNLNEATICDYCKKSFHMVCWDINKGCGTPGCKNTPLKADEPVDEEFTYFGAQTKICPACLETIPVKEENCPFCKEPFDSIAPKTQEQFKKKFNKEDSYTSEKQTANWILIGGIIGCASPLNLLFGLPWFLKNRTLLKDNLPLQYILAIVGICLSTTYILILIIAIIASS